jgi:hypothetical protein
LSVAGASFAAMTVQPPIVAEAERLIQQLAGTLTRPRRGECLCCYVARMLAEFPCDGTHRHALRYRDVMSPRATALESGLRSVGACCCDCEMFMNGYRPRPDAVARPLANDLDDQDDNDEFEDETDPFANLPECAGVRRGSVQPCSLWLRIRRGRY